MGAGAGAALKTVQWVIRGVQFCCAALILGVYAYVLATLGSRGADTPPWIRAVVGISGFAALYSGLGILLLCCFAGHKFTSFLAIVLDVAFAVAFIFVATANRSGAGSCSGQVDTPFGTGDSVTNLTPSGGDEYSGLPSFGTICKLQSACLAVAIVAIFFYMFSAATEVALGRHRHKEQRFGPGPQNDYTEGYGKRKGLFSFLPLGRSGTTKSRIEPDPNALPEHTTPDQVRTSYATETTAVPPGSSSDHHYQGASSLSSGGYGNKYNDGVSDTLQMNQPLQPTQPAKPPMAGVNGPYDTNPNAGPYPGSASSNRIQSVHYPPGNYRYSDGVYDA